MRRRKLIRSIGAIGAIGTIGTTGTQSVAATSQELGLTKAVRNKVRKGDTDKAKKLLEKHDIPHGFLIDPIENNGGDDGFNVERHYGGGDHNITIWQKSTDDEYFVQNYLDIKDRDNLSFNDASMIPDAMAISYNGNHWFAKDPERFLVTWSESNKFTLDKNLGENWEPGSGVAVDVNVPTSWRPWPKTHRHGMEATLVHTGDDRNPIKAEYRHVGALTRSDLDISLPFTGFFDVKNGKQHWSKAGTLTINDIANP